MLNFTFYFLFAATLFNICAGSEEVSSTQCRDNRRDLLSHVLDHIELYEQGCNTQSGLGKKLTTLQETLLEKLNKFESQIEKLNMKQAVLLAKINDFESRFQAVQAQFSSLQEMLRRIRRPEFKKIGSKSYFIENNLTVNWFEASCICCRKGGHLADIESEEELSAITKIIEDKTYWIGYNDLETDDIFVSSATGKKAAFLKWASGEPNNSQGNQDCVTLLNRKHMDDDCCRTSSRNFICQL